MKIQTAFSTLACPDWNWTQVIEHGSRYGYDGVEIRLLEHDTDLLGRPEFAAEELAARRRELEQHRFQVCGLASSVRFDHREDAELREQLRIGKAYVNLARELGASFVRVFGDVLPASDDPARQTVFAQIQQNLQWLGEYAEPRQVRVLIETHGDFADSRLLAELMQPISSPSVGILWDTHHPWRFFQEPLAETFARLQPWIHHTHWKDSVLRPERTDKTAEEAAADERARQLMSGHRPADYVLFGGGEFPIDECCRVLRDGGYTGWFSLEWEKAWHPEIEDPEIALPLFPGKIKTLARAAAL